MFLTTGLIMQTQWIGKNVDPKLLCQHAEDFFRERDFAVRLDEYKEQTIISAVSRNETKLRIVVKIEGEPQRFIVGFESVDEMTRSMQMLSSLVTLFGLGVLVQRKMKSLDAYRKLEDEFFTFMEETINSLVGSAASK